MSMTFNPAAGTMLEIAGIPYSVAEHPAAPGVPYGQEGRAGTVYQLQDPLQAVWALKVFRPRFRVPALIVVASNLAPYANITGLTVCQRIVLAGRRYGETIQQHPDLAYAVLMPWISGPTWFDVIADGRELTAEQCLALAGALSELLAEMEVHSMAHCDLSGANVILPQLEAASSEAGQRRVELVDVEQMYLPQAIPPDSLPAGSAGYAHRTAPADQWSAHADRFAGAVLLGEMLAWSDTAVRQNSSRESYFVPDEIQRDGLRYERLRACLRDLWGPRVARLFERAWESEVLADCPPFSEWAALLPGSDHQAAWKQPRVDQLSEKHPGKLETELGAFVVEPARTTQRHMELAQQALSRGNHVTALYDYRRALELASRGSGVAVELELIIHSLEAQLGTTSEQKSNVHFPRPVSRLAGRAPSRIWTLVTVLILLGAGVPGVFASKWLTVFGPAASLFQTNLHTATLIATAVDTPTLKPSSTATASSTSISTVTRTPTFTLTRTPSPTKSPFPSSTVPTATPKPRPTRTVTPVRSVQGEVLSSITFVNQTGQYVSVYWVDYQANEIWYGEIAPGATYVQPSYVTHPWRIRDKATGQFLYEVIATSEAQVVTII